MPPRGRGASGTGWGGRGGSGDRWGDQGAGWGYDDEGGGPPRGTGRYRAPGNDYEGVEYERALVPSMDLSPAEMQAGLPGVPGAPGMPSEDLERLLGIRRPVYIPATGKKRRLRVGTWRVLSGVLSVILVCVVACGLSTVLGKKYLASLNQSAPIHPTPPINYAAVPATPVATPGSQGVQGGGVGKNYIVSVTTAKRIDASLHPVGVTSHFLVGDTVYVVADVRNAPQGQHSACIGWYLNGQYLPLPSSSELCAVIKDQNETVYFSLPYPQAGVGMARLYWDRPANDTNTTAKDPALAQTIMFGVFEPATPTPAHPTATPAKTPAKGTPTAAPTKTGFVGAGAVARLDDWQST